MKKTETLSTQKQEFIYEVSRKFITGKSMDKIAEEIGISRRTAFNWQEKFKELIQEEKVAEFSTIEDKVLKTANDLLDSNKLGDRIKGADLFFNIMKVLEAREDSKVNAKKDITPEDILRELGIE